MQKTTIILAILALSLAGCAQSPQQIQLNPRVVIDSYIDNQPTVHLNIVDKRPSKILGTRGGTYRNSNHITLSQDLPRTLKPVASAALNEMGVIVDEASPRPTNLELIVEQLKYSVNDNQMLPIEITLHAQFAVLANKDGKQQTTRYQSTKIHRFFTAPSTEKNETIINEIVSETLTRLFNDPKLIKLIRQ